MVCSEVETELEMLFSDRGKPKSNLANTGAQFRMLVEDIREGILVSILPQLRTHLRLHHLLIETKHIILVITSITAGF